MKYIKEFESRDSDFKVGDYVLFNSGKFNMFQDFGKITYIDFTSLPYQLLNTYGYTWCEKGDILRRMTQNEIEDLDAKLDAEKYNL